MNRRQRRAAIARGEGPSDAYVETCSRMIDALRAWRRERPDEAPRFALPPRHVAAIGCLDHAPPGAIAKNGAAQVLVERFCAIGRDVGGAGAEPTIVMLGAVLDLVGVPYEIAPVESFGKFRVISESPPVDGAVRSREGLKARRCPFCGRDLLTDDARREIHHEEPECEEFRAVLAKTPPASTSRTIFATDDVDETKRPS